MFRNCMLLSIFFAHCQRIPALYTVAEFRGNLSNPVSAMRYDFVTPRAFCDSGINKCLECAVRIPLSRRNPQ